MKEEHTVLQSTHNQLLKRIGCHGDKVCTQNLMCIMYTHELFIRFKVLIGMSLMNISNQRR